MPSYSCGHCHHEFEMECILGQAIHCPHCNSVLSRPDDADLPPGSVIAGFEVVKLLGQGGMGSVYLAIQTSMQRYVALKVLPREMTEDKAAVGQFLNEVRTTGRLQHPNIVTAFDAGESEGLYYLAMTFVDGETLEARIDRDGMIPEKEALGYVLKISEALEYALQRHRLIHRDIKPGNIMVDSVEEAYLMDLGIAMRLGEVQRAKEVEGSPFYMSPEQTRGEKMDWRSDLYSLGASLYHMVVGVPPYDAPQLMRIVEMHSEAPFPEPSARNPKAKVSDATTKILRKMMEKDPSQRFASWTDFQKAVNAVLKGEKIKKKTTKLKAPPRANGPRKKKGFQLSSLVNLLLVVGLASMICYFWLRSMNEKEAVNALKRCQEYTSGGKIDYTLAMDYYNAALAASKKMGVSENTKKAIQSNYQLLSSIVEEQNRSKEICEKAVNEAKGLYKEGTALYDDGMKLFRETKSDGGKWAQAEEKCKEALRLLLTLTPPAEVQEQVTYNIKLSEGLMKQIDSSRTRMGESAAKQEQTMKRNAEQAKRAAEYKGELAKQQDKLRLSTLLAGRRKDFVKACRDAESAFSACKASEDFLKPEEQAFKKWCYDISARMADAEKLWNTLLDSENKLAGIQLTLEKGKGSLEKIEEEMVFVKIGENTERLKLIDMSGAEISPLVQKIADELGGPKFAFAYFLSAGDFAQARDFAADSNAKFEVSAIARLYIKARAKAELSKDKSSTLDKLKKDFGTLPEFEPAVKEARSESSE